MLQKERDFYSPSVKLIVGIDEAGRGPLAGPVYAAAVVFPPSFENEEINDSKKLSAKKREELFSLIKEKALGFGIASVSAEEIDRINIYQATKVAMLQALAQIKVTYDMVITDAMPLQGVEVPLLPMIKGDANCLNVAAASILAKVSRDHYLEELDRQHPQYGFKKHKGYGTKEHLAALSAYGPIPGIHRKTFAPVAAFYKEQTKLF
jgi:Ribonuclease HII